mmetsp:Transcript_35195/g.98868  ORF Transcript_35195/g.98868 Transcript_35195/m.98868 type:complete len:224 (-) Transcript_35195:734-1405(-)
MPALPFEGEGGVHHGGVAAPPRRQEERVGSGCSGPGLWRQPWALGPGRTPVVRPAPEPAQQERLQPRGGAGGPEGGAPAAARARPAGEHGVPQRRRPEADPPAGLAEPREEAAPGGYPAAGHEVDGRVQRGAHGGRRGHRHQPSRLRRAAVLPPAAARGVPRARRHRGAAGHRGYEVGKDAEAPRQRPHQQDLRLRPLQAVQLPGGAVRGPAAGSHLLQRVAG